MSVFRNSSKMDLPNSSRTVGYKAILVVRLLVTKGVLADYISEVMNEDDTEPKSSREEWDSPITFTAKSSRESRLSLLSSHHDLQTYDHYHSSSSEMVYYEQYLLMAGCDTVRF